MEPFAIQHELELAIAHQGAGHFSDAEAIYRHILLQSPCHADALHRMGLLACQFGRLDDALKLIDRAIQSDDSHATYHSDRGLMLAMLRRWDEAIAALRTAVRLDPQLPAARLNLGVALEQANALDEAIECFRAALALRPTDPRALTDLCSALRRKGLLREAIDAGRFAVAIDPNRPEAHLSLGLALRAAGRIEEAAAELRQAVDLDPGSAEAWMDLGVAMAELRRFDDALDAQSKALARAPNHASIHADLAAVHFQRGELDKALASSRCAIALDPQSPARHSGLLYMLQAHPGISPQQIREEQRRWSAKFADPLKATHRPHTNKRDANRRLRIGYVSPDFFEQAECYFVVPLLEHHNHEQFEIHCYSGVQRADHITARLRRSADAWHDVASLSDADLAEQIRADGIDVLVDLTMHMRANRMPLFARTPAPVQATWLAYPASTGLAAIDYRITDALMDPADADGSWAAESPLRLPGCWCCYDPIDPLPDVSPLPAARSGQITFGSLNNFWKMNDRVLSLWAEILARVDRSRLLLLCPDGSTRQRVRAAFESHGVRDRIHFADFLPRHEYLAMFQQIDIALDPFPYNGITTTCDALCMGVPVLSFAGDRPTARAGMSILTTLGLPELVATSIETYVDHVVGWAGDSERLAELRAGLRSRIGASPLMNAAHFARNMEIAFRKMWGKWCEAL